MNYNYWKNALEGQFSGIHDGHPQLGFYKRKYTKDGPFLPVAIWKTGDILQAVVLQNNSVNPTADKNKIDELWLSCAKHPITEEEYRYYEANGSWKSDVPSIGDNQPPSGFDALKDQIDQQATEALAWLKKTEVKTQEDADKAANWRDVLNKLKNQAEKERKEEKQPHLDAGKTVDAKYKPLTNKADDVGRKLRDALTGFLREQERIERERQRAEMLRQEEERKRLEAENKPIPEPEPIVEPQKVQVGGARGKKVSLRTTGYEAIIEDYEATLKHFSQHSEVKALIQTLANRIARAEKLDAKIPGCTIKEVKSAA